MNKSIYAYFYRYFFLFMIMLFLICCIGSLMTYLINPKEINELNFLLMINFISTFIQVFMLSLLAGALSVTMKKYRLERANKKKFG